MYPDVEALGWLARMKEDHKKWSQTRSSPWSQYQNAASDVVHCSAIRRHQLIHTRVQVPKGGMYLRRRAALAQKQVCVEEETTRGVPGGIHPSSVVKNLCQDEVEGNDSAPEVWGA